jgi:hypothetical protein
VSRRESLVALAALLLAAAALFGPQVANGGFVWDDWQNAANTHFSREPGLFGALESATERPVFGYRPVLTTLLVLEHEAFGEHVWLHLAMAALFGALTAWALYALLRTLSCSVVEAGAPAALVLAFPWADSTRLWATASYDTLAVALYLLGLTLAVRALRSGSRRLTLGSLALYLAACWTYEIVTVAVLASVAVYLPAAARRSALRRFGLDVMVVAVALAVVASGTTRDPQSLGDQIDHAGTLASQAFSLLARALVPVGSTPGFVGAALLAVAFVLAERRERVMIAVAALFVAAGYALFIPAASYYEPLAPGTTNRMNVLAAAGFAVLVYGIVRAIARPRLTPLLLLLIGAGYVVHVARDEGGWQDSKVVQDRILHAFPMTEPQPGTTFYTFDAATFVAPGIPSFSLPFDLKAAVRLKYDDVSLAAYPIPSGGGIECGTKGLAPTGGTYGLEHGEEYGHAVFVEVKTRRATTIGSRAACLRSR